MSIGTWKDAAAYVESLPVDPQLHTLSGGLTVLSDTFSLLVQSSCPRLGTHWPWSQIELKSKIQNNDTFQGVSFAPLRKWTWSVASESCGIAECSTQKMKNEENLFSGKTQELKGLSWTSNGEAKDKFRIVRLSLLGRVCEWNFLSQIGGEKARLEHLLKDKWNSRSLFSYCDHNIWIQERTLFRELQVYLFFRKHNQTTMQRSAIPH